MNLEKFNIEKVHQWLQRCVIDLSLCPFASAPYKAGKVRISVCETDSEADYLQLIDSELTKLVSDTAVEVETALVVAPYALSDFIEFNEFLAHAEDLLEIDDRQSQFQIASFHPRYQFAGVEADDAGNYTNRAPYPIVQWLRADTIAKAVEVTDTLAIPEKNIEKLKSMSDSELAGLFPWGV